MLDILWLGEGKNLVLVFPTIIHDIHLNLTKLLQYIRRMECVLKFQKLYEGLRLKRISDPVNHPALNFLVTHTGNVSCDVTVFI